MNERFELIFKSHNKAIYRLAYSYVFNKCDAEDIVQKTFYKLYNKKRIMNESDEDVKKWLFKVCTNTAKDLLKSPWKKRRCEFEETFVNENSINNKEKNIIDILRTMDKNLSIPLFLHYYEGYKINEIAKILRKSESTIKFRLSKGKKILKSELEGT